MFPRLSPEESSVGRHTESQDAVSTASSDVMTDTGQVALTRRQLRELETPVAGVEIPAVSLDSLSVSNLVADIVSKADAAIAKRIDREILEMRANATAANATAASPAAAIPTAAPEPVPAEAIAPQMPVFKKNLENKGMVKKSP